MLFPQNQRYDLEVLTPSDLVESAACPIIDPAGPAEPSRYAFLSRLLANELPLLTPPMVKGGIVRVLDLTSRSGDWALAVARTHPECEIAGVDRSRAMVDAACEQAARERLLNVSFRHADVLAQPLPFPDQRFDLINARFLASFLPGPQAWHPLLRECVRLTRPGGVIRLVECVEGEANSPACHTLYLAYRQALMQAGRRSALPYASPPQCMVWLDGLLSEAGCARVEREVTRIGWMTSERQGRRMAGYLLLTLRFLQPFLLEQGVISEAEFEQAYRALREEMTLGVFAGNWHVQASTGTVAHDQKGFSHAHIVERPAH